MSRSGHAGTRYDQRRDHTRTAAAPDTNDHHTLCMTFEEMHAVVQTAHNHGMKVTGHCRATEGIKNALRAGYDTIEHGSFIDDEGLDLLLERDVPCVPGLYFENASVERGSAGFSTKSTIMPSSSVAMP